MYCQGFRVCQCNPFGRVESGLDKFNSHQLIWIQFNLWCNGYGFSIVKLFYSALSFSCFLENINTDDDLYSWRQTKQWAVTFFMCQVMLGKRLCSFNFNIKFLLVYYLQLFACTVNVNILIMALLWLFYLLLLSSTLNSLVCITHWPSKLSFMRNIFWYSVSGILSHLIRKANGSKGVWRVVWLDLANTYSMDQFPTVNVATEHYNFHQYIRVIITRFFWAFKLQFESARFTMQCQHHQKYSPPSVFIWVALWMTLPLKTHLSKVAPKDTDLSWRSVKGKWPTYLSFRSRTKTFI